MTGPASVCARVGRTMSGPMTSFRLGHMTARRSGCSLSSMSTAGSVWLSWWPGGYAQTMFSISWPTCSQTKGRRIISAPITARSSLPRPSGPGSAGSVRNPVHRTGNPLGERIQRVLQRKAPRRASERRNLLHAAGSAGAHRTLETALQHGQATQFAGVQAPSTENRHPGKA